MRLEDLLNDFNNENSLEDDFIVQIKKEYSQMRGESIKNIRENKCFVCNESITGYCKSHSVPRFALKKIKGSGEIGTHFSVIKGFEEKVFGSSKGINNAGTFKLICRECDKNFFKDYEELSNYDSEPTSSN